MKRSNILRLLFPIYYNWIDVNNQIDVNLCQGKYGASNISDNDLRQINKALKTSKRPIILQ